MHPSHPLAINLQADAIADYFFEACHHIIDPKRRGQQRIVRNLELDAAACTVDLLPVLAHQFDEPIVDSSMLPTYLVSRLVRAHCTVALGGDGGDELFGGYIHYDRLLWMQRNLGWIPLPMRRLK